MASNSGDSYEPHGSLSTANKLRVLILGSEWGSSNGGLSTINREFAIHLAKHSKVHVTFLVPQCSDRDKSAANAHSIDLREAQRVPGMKELLWLTSPPCGLPIDIVIGHGRKLGPQAWVISTNSRCKWVQFVHTAPEELSMHKEYPKPISRGENKHKTEVELCESADFVVTIGSRLNKTFRSCLSSCKTDENVFCFTPGVFRKFSEIAQVPDRSGKFQVLLICRGDAEDFKLKGLDIAAEAIALLPNTHLVFVGAPEGKQEEIAKCFLDIGLPADSLTVKTFTNQEALKKICSQVDLLIMPSRTEGFGLTGLEALSAALPLLVGQKSGFAEALKAIPFGSYSVVDSDKAVVWSSAIKNVMGKSRKVRLEESKTLRAFYEKEFSWEKQIEELVGKMITLVCTGPHSSERGGRNPQSRGSQYSMGQGQSNNSIAREGSSRSATALHDTRPVQRGEATSSLTTENEGHGFTLASQAGQQCNGNDSSHPTGSGVNQFPSGVLFGGDNDEKCIVCTCGHLAKRWTVKKDNPNKGRQFYKCPNYNRSNGCEFFLWADNSQRRASSTASQTTLLTPSNNVNRNHAGFNSGQNLPSPAVSGSMKAQTSSPSCHCKQPAVSRTVSKDGPNKGHPFYCCAKPRGHGCDFFEWGDAAGPSAGASNRCKRQSSATNGVVKKKRKCGLCHQEGHTKRTCTTRRL